MLVSSTIGHKLMDDHIFKKERISQSHLNFSKLKKSIDSNDLDSFIEVVENEALTLHALMIYLCITNLYQFLHHIHND